ncbi:MAG: hypothetical protein ABSH29_17040 [Acidimicrobiales bacterium]
MDEQRHHSGQRFPVPNDDDPWTCSARQDVTVPTDHPGWRRAGPALTHCKVVPSLDEGLEALKLRNNLGFYGQVHIVAVVCLSLNGPSLRSGPAEGAIIQHFSVGFVTIGPTTPSISFDIKAQRADEDGNFAVMGQGDRREGVMSRVAWPARAFLSIEETSVLLGISRATLYQYNVATFRSRLFSSTVDSGSPVGPWSA